MKTITKTDLEDLTLILEDCKEIVKILTRAGIEFELTVEEASERKHKWGWKPPIKTPASINIKVDGGYLGFFTLFTFDMDGTLKKIGAYE